VACQGVVLHKLWQTQQQHGFALQLRRGRLHKTKPLLVSQKKACQGVVLHKLWQTQQQPGFALQLRRGRLHKTKPGGAGNRTRVRERDSRGLYMLSLSL